MQNVIRFISPSILLLSAFALLELTAVWGLHHYFRQDIIWPVDPAYLRYGIIRNELSQVKSIVLGGSTVCSDTLRFMHSGRDLEVSFCNPCAVLPKPCYNAAHPALTIVDSWYIYQSLSKLKYLKYVFLLNGINDARSNNITSDLFDVNYRHIQFYDEAYILFSHPEISWTAIPTLIHLLLSRTKDTKYLPKENLQNLSALEKVYFLAHGHNIKSEEAFTKKMGIIIETYRARNHSVVIGTFPYYHPANYSRERFESGMLDYSQAIFPTELYGEPDNVVKAISIHNDVIRNAHRQAEDFTLIEFDRTIPRTGFYFNDICHLSPAGCEVLYHELHSVISAEE